MTTRTSRSARALLVGIIAIGLGACASTGDDVDSTDTTAPAATEASQSPTTDTSESSDTTATPASTEPALPQEPGQGVTDTEIKIGVTYPDLTAVQDFVDVDHGDYASAFQILADAVNEAGGINGRQIVLVQGPVNVIGTDSAATVCTQLTEDEEVFAVIGVPQADTAACYVEDHDTALVGGQQTEDLLESAVAPWFSYVPTLDRRAFKGIEGMASEGVFDGATVGMISLPVHENLIADSIDPVLEAAGVEVSDRAVIDTPADDPNAGAVLTATILERFRAEGIDSIIVVSDAFVTVGNALLQTDYRPRLLSTDQDAASGWLFGKDDKSPAVGLITAAPDADTATVWNSAGTQGCVDTILAAEPDRQITNPATRQEGEPETFVSVLTACRAMSLFVAIAEAAGPALNNETFRAAGESLGEFPVPGTGGGQTYAPGAPSGDGPVYLARFDESIGDLVWDETPVP